MTRDGPTTPRDYFARVPKWSHYGPPLRPSPDDVAVVQRAVARLGTAARAVVLGLTPEIIGCAWPDDVDLSAVDHSPAMIDKLWPPERQPRQSRALLADWCAMPIPTGTIDLVAGDGCYIVRTYPEEFATLTQAVRRILRPSGQFVIRAFLRPDKSESVTEVGSALARGEIGSVHALKLRLLAALHGASGAGSHLGEGWDAWKSLPPLPHALQGKRGWTDEEIVGIDAWRGLEMRFFLPTLAEFRAVLLAGFAEVECARGSHELADRCPTFVFAGDGQP